MKKSYKNNKIIITFLILIPLILCISCAIILAVTLKDDYNINSITVNNFLATINKDKASVEIEQAKIINVSVKSDKDIQIKIFKDKELTQSISNYDEIEINGIDTSFYITTGKNNKIKKTYILTIKNKMATENEIVFKINGSVPKLENDEFYVTLSDLTTELNFSIESSLFFTYLFYFDKNRQQLINDVSRFTLPDKQSSIYLDIYNINQKSVVKSYKINFVFTNVNDGRIQEIYVNGIKGNINNKAIKIDVERANVLILDIKVDKDTKYEVFSDIALSTPIENIKNIINTNLSGEPLTYYIKTISTSGAELIYSLCIHYILDDNSKITSMNINGTLAFIEDMNITVLIERSASLNIDTICASPRASISFYSDYTKKHKINKTDNIDISNHTKETYQLFASVIAENGQESFYSIIINFVLSNKTELLDVKANNQSAIIKDNQATLQYIGTPDTFILSIQNIRVSKYAIYQVFYDSACSQPLNIENEIQLTSNHQNFYIKITAENKQETIKTLTVNLVSNDNDLKGITINNQEFIISEEVNELYIESNTKLQINELKYDTNSEISLYYDALQTKPILDLNNVDFNDNIGQIYIRIVSETGEIKVFSIKIIFKNAPAPKFIANTIQLNDWQSIIPLNELFYMEGNSYNDNHYEYEVYWNNNKQNTQYISIENINKIYDLKVIIISPYFENIEYNKSIEILPYSLTKIDASLLLDNYSTKDDNEILKINELVSLNSGSYTIGKDFYIEVSYPNATKQVIINMNDEISIMSGKYSFFINAFNNYFDTIIIGEMDITIIEKNIPEITGNEFIEITESDSTINVSDYFTINKNDYEIILIKSFVNGLEKETISCFAGIYTFKLQAYYSNGMVEKEIKVEIATISDNTSIEVLINGKTLTFTNNITNLPNLKYNDVITIEGKNYNSKSNIVLKVNNIISEFGVLSLSDGNNTIAITVTAESGRSDNYYITVYKNTRILPTISTQPQTVKLTKYQNYINFEDFYTIHQNDYLSKTSLYYNNKELKNNILEVDNITNLYCIEIVLTGEYGSISETLEIGVLPYTEIEIRFNSSVLKIPNANYVFSLNDFIDEIIYYGIVSNTCTYELICDEEIFTSKSLEEGEHYFTINIWQDNIILKTETRWFNIIFTSTNSELNVKLTNAETIISQKNQVADINDHFEIDYGTYDKNSLIIRFIYAESTTPQSTLILKNGKNYFTLQIMERLSEQELFRNEYMITCNYIADSENIITDFNINNIYYLIDGNDIIVINNAPLSTAKISYTSKSGFSVFNLPNTMTLHEGLNQIYYYVEETDGSSYMASLNIYNLCRLNYYISSITYNNHLIQDNEIVLDENTIFELDKLKINYNNSEHIQIIKTVKNLNDKVYDVILSGKYDDKNIGDLTIRIYIGTLKPRLFDISTKIIGDDICYYGINEYDLELVAKTDSNFLTFEIQFIDKKYSIINNMITNFNYGNNNLNLIIKDNNTSFEYQYDLNIVIFPNDMLNSITYNSSELPKSTNYYIVNDSSSINEDLIDVSIKDLSSITTTLRSSEIKYNEEIIGIKYGLYYNSILIQNVIVTIENDNSSLICTRDDVTLEQSGNNILTDNIKIRKSNSIDMLNKTYYFKCVYPLTNISNDNFTYDESVGYYINTDLSYLLKKDVGAYIHTIQFDVITVSSKITYSLQITIEIYEITEENAALTVNINTNSKIYFEANELNSNYIIANDNLTLDILTSEINISINNNAGYNLYDNDKNIVENLLVSLIYDSNSNYITFNIGLKISDLKTIIIYIEPYTDENKNVIETACIIDGQQINILEEADYKEIIFNNEKYTVSVANKSVILPSGTSEINATLYGLYANQYGFVFKNGDIGNEGILEIVDDHILLYLRSGNTIIPYAIIEVLLV